MAAKFARIGLQLFSELCLDLARQSEILPFRIKGTYFVTDIVQLLAQRLSPSRDGFATEQSSEDSVLLRNVMADRQPSALFPADHNLVLHDEFADVLESDG